MTIMSDFGKFYLDKEKDIIVELSMTEQRLEYVLRTPNHAKGNLIANLARLCGLELSTGDDGLKVICGEIPCYIDERNREVYVLRLADTKIANIYPDGSIERKAYVPAISKTLMSQTKDYSLDAKKTLVKTYILREYKFRTDLHTHMNANLDADLLIALGIFYQIRYPLYYIKKLNLRCTAEQLEMLAKQRKKTAVEFKDYPLEGKYHTRKIDDNTFINFADFILNNLENAAYNITKIRASLTILKDSQAVFTNLEKVYLYRYVFTKGKTSEHTVHLSNIDLIPDEDIRNALNKMIEDKTVEPYKNLSLFQNKLLWIARSCKKCGVEYIEISDTTLVKPEAAPKMLAEVHSVMPSITRETGVTIRFLAAVRRIPLTIVRDKATAFEDVQKQILTIRAVANDPYVAGSDIIGEEINDIRELRSVIGELVSIARDNEGFVIRIHAGENDGLRDNVQNSLACVRDSLSEGQEMPYLRIGHGLYTANLNSQKGKELIKQLKESRAVLEFQLTSNVRLNNLSSLDRHPIRRYLEGGVSCVQGTDGGAIYGTDSIDEQLALERLLDLSRDEMLAMRRAEQRVFEKSMKVFYKKYDDFTAASDGCDVEEYYNKMIANTPSGSTEVFIAPQRLSSAEFLSSQICELPTDKVPVILLGGSFNSKHHSIRIKPKLIKLIDNLIEKLDPEKVCFVIGNRLSAYEKELVNRASGRFEIYAIVPTRITPAELKRLKASKVGIRVSIEPTGMGLYKSFAYEIFKRRPSVVVALDGNSAGANTIQEANNGKKKARIFVYHGARVLNTKARMIQGYVTVFKDEAITGRILLAVDKVFGEMNKG